MTRKPRALTRQMERLIETALMPGRFVSYNATFSFVRSDLDSLIVLLLETKELERLADVLRGSPDEALESVSHYVTEPAAKKLEKIHPDVAARLWCAQGMRIVKAKKSKYYEAALCNFERARRCFERAGLVVEWQRVVEKVRIDHGRKSGLMAGFEEIVAASGPSQRPSFLQRATARWA